MGTKINGLALLGHTAGGPCMKFGRFSFSNRRMDKSLVPRKIVTNLFDGERMKVEETHLTLSVGMDMDMDMDMDDSSHVKSLSKPL